MTRVAALASGVSMTTTVLAIALRPPLGNAARLGSTLEALALLGLIVIVVRSARPREAVVTVVLLSTAATVWVLRFHDSEPSFRAVAWCAIWTIFAIGAAAAGGWLRLAAARHRRTLIGTVRLELARDLHDFVAHDISGVVAQAQAARFVAETDPGRALAALERIEAAGLQALTSMDRTVSMLHGTPAPSSLGLADLPELTGRFASAGPADVRLQVDPALGTPLPREIDATAYRLVTEALTNVRRHAPAATTVTITLHRADGPALAITVTNDTGSAWRRAPGSGSGLIGLGERVRALGGTLDAGPYGTGWRISAALPLNARSLAR
ncbi:sensor histidine kinase [Spirillospora sp. CA-294931]|uniref:sensor histidine kinase n=1 Tax=Spirillospora sp. CA-294931 TaxID=3240042 RepID=UPI003D90A223